MWRIIRMIRKNVKLKNGMVVEVKESNDEIGFIIDVFKGDELIKTETFWYDNFE